MGIYYYIIFACLVAVFKTVYYIRFEKREHFKGITRKQLIAVIVLTFTISFILAPVVMIELIIDIVKNTRRSKV